MLDIGSGVSDDDFFHLTCHIEPSLIHKIENGEFVELEKLLPKERLGGKTEEGRLEWVHRDGGTYLVPALKDSKIGSFRRWEQAFQAYATTIVVQILKDPKRFGNILQLSIRLLPPMLGRICITMTLHSIILWHSIHTEVGL